jgi:transcriptional regulator with XRE-family HTH domain
MTVEQALGDALRHTRERRGLSQEQLAGDAGLDRTYISLIERGQKSPTLRTLLRLADVLDVAPSKIVREMERRLTR